MTNGQKYGDIIDLPHHVSDKHPPLSRESRAAQFSPFAALTGYDGIVAESARLTDIRSELGEADIDILGMKLRLLADRASDHPEVTVTYFLPDERKSGGAYVKKTAQVKRIDEVGRIIFFTDKASLAIDDITDIQGEIFAPLQSIEG